MMFAESPRVQDVRLHDPPATLPLLNGPPSSPLGPGAACGDCNHRPMALDGDVADLWH